MSDYWFEVRLDGLVCRDTESLHSSDKFGLAGAVLTDVASKGFIMPMMRINDGETRTFPDDLKVVFNGPSGGNKIRLSLTAWDLDQNSAWTDNRESIMKTEKTISEQLKKMPPYGPPIGYGLDVATLGIDQLIKADNDDELGRFDQWVDGPDDIGFHQWGEKPLSLRFYRSDGWGYSDWDYSLDLTIRCQYTPLLFSPGSTPPPAAPSYQPFQGSQPATWHGSWEGPGIKIAIGPGSWPRFLNVTVTENVQENTMTTTTKNTALTRLGVELLHPGLEGKQGIASDHSAFVPNKLTARVVRFQEHGSRVISREVLLGEKKSALGPSQVGGISLGEMVTPQQFGGDYLLLNHDGSLEMYHVIQNGKVIGEALKYRRPTSKFLSVSGAGVEVMLHREVIIR